MTIAATPDTAATLPVPTAGLAVRRQVAGGVLLVAGLPTLTVALVQHRADSRLAIPVLLMLLLVVLSSLVGGLRIALPGAVAGALVLNWFFTKPYGTLSVAQPAQLVVLLVYLTVAVLVSLAVGTAARRTAEATRAGAEADAMSELAGATLSSQETLPALLERVRTVFGVREVALLELEHGSWAVVDSASVSRGVEADEVDLRIPAGPSLALAVRGHALFAADRRILTGFAGAAATALEGRRLAARAQQAAVFEAADRTRTALLSAVGHDLRTPLAGIKAAVSSLRQDDITWSERERQELLATVELSADRLQALVENLLDASRLHAGVVSAHPRQVSLDELVGLALLSLPQVDRVHVEVPESLPDLLADAGLTERVLVNVLQNALRYSPGGTLVTIRGSASAEHVRCDVVDHGPGLPADQWARVFSPFQRLGDRTEGGLGLGLSVARGLSRAMGGELTPSTTPGGGLTMRLSLPRAVS